MNSETVTQKMNETYNDVVKNIKNINFNDVVRSLLYLFLILYASFVRPELPRFLETLFKNNLFRLFVFFLINLLNVEEIVLIVSLLSELTSLLFSIVPQEQSFLHEAIQHLVIITIIRELNQF